MLVLFVFTDWRKIYEKDNEEGVYKKMSSVIENGKVNEIMRVGVNETKAE